MYKVIGTSILDAGGTLLRYLYTLLSLDFCFVFAFRLNTFGRKNMFINIHKMCAFECDVVSGVVGSSCELMIGQSLVADDSSSVFGGGTGILAFPNCGQQFVTREPAHWVWHTQTDTQFQMLYLYYKDDT